MRGSTTRAAGLVRTLDGVQPPIRIHLDPLTRDEQALQIADIRGVPPHRALLDDVYARAEGNPFFAEELAHPDRAIDLVQQAIAAADDEDAHLRGWLHERRALEPWSTSAVS